MRAVSVALLLVALTAAGCGSADDAGPRGEPVGVVRRAPDRTEAAGWARVAGAASGVQSDGSVDLRTGVPRVTVKGHQEANPFLTDPALAIDLVRGAVRVVTYGGVEVQGVGTIRFELDVDPVKAIAGAPAARRDRLAKVLPPQKQFYADVYIDTQGRIRRVLLPADLSVPRQYGKSQITNQEMTVDFYGFARKQAA